MRFDINLASQPYIDARQFYSRWMLILGGAALLLLLLLGLLFARRTQLRDLDAQIRDTREKLTKVEQERATGQSILERPENSATRAQAQFLNQLFLRKSFRWTQILAELERLDPPHVQVQTIHPQLRNNGALEIQFVIAAPQRDQAIEFVRRLEGSRFFSAPRLTSESAKAENGVANTTFSVTADYVRDTGSTTGSTTGGR